MTALKNNRFPMNRTFLPSVCLVSLFLAQAASAVVPLPANMVAEGLPPVPVALRDEVRPYLQFRSASFQGWHPQHPEMLIVTRFGNTAQLHRVKAPEGARRQLTYQPEPVTGGSYRPLRADCIVFSQDRGGMENFQLYRQDLASGRVTLLTDDRARNNGGVWSPDGKLIAYSSNARNFVDFDIWVLDPDQPEKRRLVCETLGGGWTALDWSPCGKMLLLREFRSASNSLLHIADVASGMYMPLTETDDESPVSLGKAVFSRRGNEVYLTSDEGAEFKRLGHMTLEHQVFLPWTGDIPWGVEGFDLSPDGKTIAFTTNEDGVSRLRFLSTADGSALPAPELPAGVISGLQWSADGARVGFSMSSAHSPADAYSVEPATGKVTRWTFSEAGGLDTESFREPEIIRIKGFDGLALSGLYYRPDPERFPGPRPVLVILHGGPEGQSRPSFQARNNYFLNEMGVALLFPNVRGSAGFGKTFLSLDDGFLREDSVKDLGSFLDWVPGRPELDAGRVALMGGSYGGYMTLAGLIHFGDKVRCGCDVVGISNFLTFLENTADYRRDMRRTEYGDETDPEMHAFLAKISPTARAAEITRPLFIVQGGNDPRVPLGEAEQMAAAVRAAGAPVWYLMARDEGHGFRRKPNADYQFLSAIRFFRKYLLEEN